MRNLVFALAAIGILAATMGCANGPTRQWMQGAPCNTCTPPISQPCDNCASGCDSGNCSGNAIGSGFLGGLFRPNANANANICPPTSLPATNFNQAPVGFASDTINPVGGTSTEFYGNTINAGRLETPPIGPYNN